MKLTHQDRSDINAITNVMMRMNDRNDINASQDSTYGHLWNAIYAIVHNNYKAQLADINWGGNATWADDVEKAIIWPLAIEEIKP